jgi:REP element-mobilizing transposase RayT
MMKIASLKQIALQQPNKGWHSRGYLPHFDSENEIQSLNFRLYDAVPMCLIEEWRRQLGWSRNLKQSDPRAVALRQRIETYEDVGYGQCFLHDSRIAKLTEDALQYFDGVRYRLLAWCVMPNHVHSLIEMVKGFSLGGILHSWKSYTAKKANRILGRNGQFWDEDYYDRYIRDDDHLRIATEYIEQNPVKARLVTNATQWKYSSACRRP